MGVASTSPKLNTPSPVRAAREISVAREYLGGGRGRRRRRRRGHV